MFNVNDYAINKAVLLVQEYGAVPILCIGERLWYAENLIAQCGRVLQNSLLVFFLGGIA